MAQTFEDFPASEDKSDSRPKIAQRDEALRSTFSGTAFPTTPTPVEGQLCFRTDLDATFQFVNSAWVALAGAVADGDKGDVTVSASGATWTIDADAVTNTKLRNSAAVSVIGRSPNTSGDPGDIAAGANDRVLGRTGDALSFLQITVGMLTDATITFAKLATSAVATASEYWSNTASKLVSVATAWLAADPVTITFSATQTLDFNTFVNGVITLTNNTVLQTPSNRKKGQSGCIELIQDGTGTRTMDSTNTAFVWAGGTNGVLSTAAGARDLLSYYICDDDKVFLTLNKGLA